MSDLACTGLLPPPLNPGCDSVLLDFDGTLVALAERPDAVVIDAALGVLLRRLARDFAGRVALVSGRSVAQLEVFVGSALAGLGVVGSHGAEVRAGGRMAGPARPDMLDGAADVLRRAFDEVDGVIIEEKSLGVAVHYRLAPDAEPVARGLVRRIAAQTGLAVQDGKMMIELHAAGHDKGTGIAALMAVVPFAGSVPVFVGDDLTDEAGFAAVRAMGGHGVLVGAERATAARFRLDDVAAVRRWLERAP